MEGISSLFDWSHLAAAVVLPVVYASLRLVFGALIKGPARYLASQNLMIRMGATLWPWKHPNYSGEWTITWYVESDSFPAANSSTVRLHKFLKSITAEISVSPQNQPPIRYRFVGKLFGHIATGDWFDGTVSRDGYYGSFQIIMHPTGRTGEGQWLGFSRTGVVKSGRLTWEKVMPGKR